MKDWVSYVLTVIVMVISGIISLAIVRTCAIVFANPKPYLWSEVFVSTSPNAKSYHYSEDCKFLRKTKYEIAWLSYEEAEFEEGLTPCKSCLKESIKYEFDYFVGIIILPVMLLLAWITDKTIKFSKEYTFRNPIIRKSNT